MSLFKPVMYKKSIFDIDYDRLKKKGIRLVIFDLDNTIAKIDEKKPNKVIKDFLEKLSKEFDIVIASNSPKKRVINYCQQLKCLYFWNMLKPTKKIYRKIIQNNKFIKSNEICMIGDQIMTDILTANRIGAMSILVDPLGKKDLKITNFNRLVEKRVMKKLEIKRGNYYEEE